MNKEEKELVEEIDDDTEQVKKLEGDIKRSFIIILGIAGFVLFGLIGLAIYAHLADDTYTTQTGLPSSYEYNEFPFTKNGHLWQTRVFKETEAGLQQYDLLVYYSPLEVDKLEITDSLYRYLFDADTVVLALNDTSLTQPGSSAQAAVAAIELGKVVGNKYNLLNKNVYTAVIDPTEAVAKEIKIVDCSISTNQTRVVVFGLANKTRVYESADGCIHVEGETGADIIRAADRYMYQVLGVMR